MLAGHYGVALGLKRYAPRMSLFWLLVASSLLDLIFWPLVLLGVENFTIPPDFDQRHYLFFDFPYSHSVLSVIIFAALFAVFGLLFRRSRRRNAAAVLAIAVISHWVLDWLVHSAEMPIAPGRALKTGAGLWNHIWLASVVELAILLVGLAMYYSITRPRDRLGKYGLVVLFIGVAVVSLAGQLFGEKPPSLEVVALSSLGLQIVVLVLAGWFDSRRAARGSYRS